MKRIRLLTYRDPPTCALRVVRAGPKIRSLVWTSDSVGSVGLHGTLFFTLLLQSITVAQSGLESQMLKMTARQQRPVCA